MGAVISLDYGAMDEAGRAAGNAAKKCRSYAENINKKISKKVSSLTLGGNGNTAQIDYFARCKINELNQRIPRYEEFATKVANAKSYAESTDKNVSGYIRKAANDFRKSHDMKVGIISEFFAWATTTLLNKTTFGRWLNQITRTADAWLDMAKRNFKNWYELDGGKYIIKAALAVVGTVIATIFLVTVAWPVLVSAVSVSLWTAVTAAATYVAAVIAVADGVVKSVNSIKAVAEFQDDPGWAKRFGSFTSLSEYMRKTNFHVPFLDKISNIAANIIEVVKVAAEIIGLADLIQNGIKVVKVIKENGIGKMFNKVHFQSPGGKITICTIKHGMKNVIRNAGQLKEMITSTNIARLKTFYEKNSIMSDFYKGLKKGEKVIKTVDSLAEKGIKGEIKERMEKIINKKITYQYVPRSVDVSKKMKERIKTHKPVCKIAFEGGGGYSW